MATPAYDADLRKALKELYDRIPCNPIMVRLAWHDAGTYNKDSKTGGANASIRFCTESSHAANNGLAWALERMDEVKEKFPDVSFADLYQLASVVAIEHAGGPQIPFRYGRKDATQEQCTETGRLPDAGKGVPHLRDVFHRMGLSDQDIVALSGAHTLGRAHFHRSGFEGAWTKEPLKFDNSYFKELLNPSGGLLHLPTDDSLLSEPSMKSLVEKYAADQDAFFSDYVESHKKLSELGMDS